MQRISSPEQLDDYIHLSNPGVWMILAAVIVLLAGVCVWGIFGRLDTTIDCVCIADGGKSAVYIKEAQISSVKEGMEITVDGQTYAAGAVGAEPVSVDDTFSEYALHTGNLTVGEWVYEVTLNAALPEGVYGAEIVIESVAPMSFVIDREGL
ncbi:MAG: hypothetical protein NC400_06505 [Clostridium sp.]|nr:hypothetical protein [Clostridium sp.]